MFNNTAFTVIYIFVYILINRKVKYTPHTKSRDVMKLPSCIARVINQTAEYGTFRRDLGCGKLR